MVILPIYQDNIIDLESDEDANVDTTSGGIITEPKDEDFIIDLESDEDAV